MNLDYRHDKIDFNEIRYTLSISLRLKLSKSLEASGLSKESDTLLIYRRYIYNNYTL